MTKHDTDTLFTTFVTSCHRALAADGPDPWKDIAILTESFAKRWRMPDTRFRTLRPKAPYASYLLYLDSAATLCVVLDIFMPGQTAIIHNHRCSGVFVCLEGAERERRYRVPEDLSQPPAEIHVASNPVGAVQRAAAARHAFHQVECASSTPGISLHIYGADIGRIIRDYWDAAEAAYLPFCSGYTNGEVGLGLYLDP